MLQAKRLDLIQLWSWCEGSWYQVDIGTVAVTILRHYKGIWYMRTIWHTDTRDPQAGGRRRLLDDDTENLAKAMHALEKFWIELTRDENPTVDEDVAGHRVILNTTEPKLHVYPARVWLSWRTDGYINSTDLGYGYPQSSIKDLKQTALEVYKQLRQAYLSTVEQ